MIYAFHVCEFDVGKASRSVGILVSKDCHSNDLTAFAEQTLELLLSRTVVNILDEHRPLVLFLYNRLLVPITLRCFFGLWSLIRFDSFGSWLRCCFGFFCHYFWSSFW